MDIAVQYGEGTQRLSVGDGRLIGLVAPRNTPADVDSVARSIHNPIGSTDLDSFLAERKRILVVVNDHTRATPSPLVLKNLNLRNKETTTIIAGGTHRSPNSVELTNIIGGASPPYGGEVVIHDSRKEEPLSFLGTTSRGTPLQMNPRLFDADGIIAVGSVEPHYFAGFTGGRKFFLPALAGVRSIEMNHALALNPRAEVLCLDGNPVHEDFMEALQLFNRNQDVFSIQLVLNSRQEVCYTSSGHVIDSFKTAVEQARNVYTTNVKCKADIIVAITKPPLDIDLYQSLKSVENTKLALKDDGVMILVSKCPDGIGNRAFYNLLAGGAEAIRKARESRPFGCHKAIKLSDLLSRARVFAVTSLPSKDLEAIGVRAFDRVQKAVEEAMQLLGSGSKVLLVDDAAVAVPVPE